MTRRIAVTNSSMFAPTAILRNATTEQAPQIGAVSNADLSLVNLTNADGKTEKPVFEDGPENWRISVVPMSSENELSIPNWMRFVGIAMGLGLGLLIGYGLWGMPL